MGLTHCNHGSLLKSYQYGIKKPKEQEAGVMGGRDQEPRNSSGF